MSGETDQVKWRGVRPISGIQGVWPARNSVRVNESESMSDTGVAIVYTVPANKKLFISSVNLSSRNTVVQLAAQTVKVRNDSDVDQYVISSHYHSVVAALVSHQLFPIALEAPAGWDVVLTQTPDDTAARATLFGWLEDE